MRTSTRGRARPRESSSAGTVTASPPPPSPPLQKAPNQLPSTSRPCCKDSWRWKLQRSSRTTVVAAPAHRCRALSLASPQQPRLAPPLRPIAPLPQSERRRRHRRGWWHRRNCSWPVSAVTAPGPMTTALAPDAAGSAGRLLRPQRTWLRHSGAATPAPRGSFSASWATSRRHGQAGCLAFSRTAIALMRRGYSLIYLLRDRENSSDKENGVRALGLYELWS